MHFMWCCVIIMLHFCPFQTMRNESAKVQIAMVTACIGTDLHIHPYQSETLWIWRISCLFLLRAHVTLYIFLPAFTLKITVYGERMPLSRCIEVIKGKNCHGWTNTTTIFQIYVFIFLCFADCASLYC